MPGTAAAGKAFIEQLRFYYRASAQVRRPVYPMPAQRQAEVRGTPTHAQLSVLYRQPTLCSFVRHWERHRQLIAVTCIAEHA